jgi:type II secretory pathway pseudopilin PulG
MGRTGLIMKDIFKKVTAMTLVELLIVAMLTMLIFGGGVAATVTMMRFLKEESVESAATENLANALEWIKKDAIRSDEADTSSPNSVTLYIHDNMVDPPVDYKIIYLVENDTQLLRRQLSPLPEEDRLVTDMIDEANLPNFNIMENNYLSMEIWIRDPGTGASARSRTGIMMRCRATH